MQPPWGGCSDMRVPSAVGTPLHRGTAFPPQQPHHSSSLCHCPQELPPHPDWDGTKRTLQLPSAFWKDLKGPSGSARDWIQERSPWG